MENIPRIELIQVAETVAREKLIDKEDVILAMEDAIQRLQDLNMVWRET